MRAGRAGPPYRLLLRPGKSIVQVAVALVIVAVGMAGIPRLGVEVLRGPLHVLPPFWDP
ncbi:MAG: hypothetical protein M3170_00555 [Candidatus Dormibacteraeota bacterium]|nr:hypothetical protein [Candidatus Dormibacteraeota bacterium]